MTEQTEQAPTRTGAVPARIELDDFIEAVSRGIARALEAQEEVSGYAMALPGRGPGPILIGIYFPNNPGDGSGGGGSRPPIREEK